MRDKRMRKIQKDVTKHIRAMNKQIAEDDMFLGRIELRQINAQWSRFDDNSGYAASFLIAVVDKATGASFATWIDYSTIFFGAKIWRIANDALVAIFDVWKDRSKLQVDYTNVVVKEVDFYTAPYIYRNWD